MQTSGTAGHHLVIGEVVADVVQPRSGAPVTHPGGSPANVAVGLARLGAAVTLMTQIGHDAHGDLIRAHLAAARVRVLAVPGPGVVNAMTPCAVAHLDDSGAATYVFDITWTLPPAAPPSTPSHVHTGSLATLMAPGADSVEALVRDLRPQASVSFDPNIRPTLLTDHADAVARVERMIALSDVVKASDQDLEYLYPAADPVLVATRWLEAGPAIVVLTLGGEGSICVTRAGTVKIAPTVVTVADTVGAGDAFMSALIDGLSRDGLLGADRRTELARIPQHTAARLCRRASRAAAITVARPGAAPPDLAELEARA